MVRVTVTSLWARRRRFASVFVAVALGVAFLTGTAGAGRHAEPQLRPAVHECLGRHRRRGPERHRGAANSKSGPGSHALINEALLKTVQAVPGVAAQGQVSGTGTLLGQDGTAIGGGGPPRLAGSWVTVSGLNPYRLVQGRARERRTRW